MDKYRILSLNARGLGNKCKRQIIYKYIRDGNFDIACIQETHSTKDIENLWLMEWGGRIIFSHGTSNARGSAIFINKRLENNVKIVVNHQYGRFNIIYLHIFDFECLLCNIYGLNVDDESLFIEIQKIIKSNDPPMEIIILGDLNVAIDPKLDRSENKQPHQKNVGLIESIIAENNLCDAWRVRNPQTKLYSWSRGRSGSRLDYCLVTPGINNLIPLIEYSVAPRTDHMGLFVNIEKMPNKRGSGLWRFNNVLLSDIVFCTNMTNVINSALSKYADVDSVMRWESIKMDIGKYCRAYGKSKAAAAKAEINEINKTLQQIHNISLTRDLTEEIQTSKLKYQRKLDAYYEKKAEAAAFRSRCKWLGEGEKSTKYFLSLEKLNYNKKSMNMLQDENDGTIVTDQMQILEMQRCYYERLYTSDSNVHFQLVNDTNIKISDIERGKLDNKVLKPEIRASLMSMQNDKAPGCDGLTVNFYKHFWNLLENAYFEMINTAIAEKCMPLSSMKGTISLLPKGSKNPLLLKNWRPLTLLNNDYKIMAKLLARRIQPTLDNIISNDQTGFMKGRQISTTIRKTLDIIHELETQHKNGLILNLDFVKCFDKIEINSVLGALEYFNYGPVFIQMVALLQEGFQSCVVNNGYISSWFDVTRSIHQGDPLAAYNFLVCGEVLSHILRKNQDIKPLMFGDFSEFLSQFADDTQVFEENDELSLNATVDCMNLARKNLGLETNFEKSKIHIVSGHQLEFDSVNSPWSVTNEYPIVLGIETAPDNNQLFALLDKSRNILKQWHRRLLSMTGKILVINSLIASLYVYVLQVVDDPPSAFYTEYENIVEEFLWGEKKAKVSLSTLYAPKYMGGLGLVNIKWKTIALKIAWIFRQDAYVEDTLGRLLPCTLGTLFWDCTLRSNRVNKYINNTKPEFWKQICYHWFDYTWTGTIPEEVHEIKAQIIWCNSYICVNDCELYIDRCIAKGLIYLTQLLDDENYEWLALDYVKQQFDLDWYTYTQIKKATPKKWLRTLQRKPNREEMYVTKYEEIRKCKKKCKAIYKNIAECNSKTTLVQLHQKITKKVVTNFDIYEKAFKDLYYATNIVKLRDFQYRLLIGAIYTNGRLFHWKLVSNQNCDWCGCPKQTVVHMLFDCIYATKIWDCFANFVKESFPMFQIDIANLCYSKIFLGSVHPDKRNLINFLVLVVKHYLFVSKCEKRLPCFDDVKNKIHSLQRMERYNANMSGNVQKHDIKWGYIVKINKKASVNLNIEEYLLSI